MGIHNLFTSKRTSNFIMKLTERPTKFVSSKCLKIVSAMILFLYVKFSRPNPSGSSSSASIPAILLSETLGTSSSVLLHTVPLLESVIVLLHSVLFSVSLLHTVPLLESVIVLLHSSVSLLTVSSMSLLRRSRGDKTKEIC